MRTITVPLKLIDLNGDGFHLFVEIQAFGKKHFAVIDTGASRSVFDKEFVEKNISAVEEVESAQAVTLFTTSATIQSVIPKLKIGKLTIKKYPVIALDLSTVNDAYAQHNHPGIIAILGSDIFYNYAARINYKKLKAYFSSKPRHTKMM